MHLKLELKVIADVGLIGFPSVSANRRSSALFLPRVQDRQLPLHDADPLWASSASAWAASFVCADIPGLIGGAAEGVGLGHDFLRHVERCRLLLHVVDVSGCEGRDPVLTLRRSTTSWSGSVPSWRDRPQIVLGIKCDIARPEQVEDFKLSMWSRGSDLPAHSAATRQAWTTCLRWSTTA